MRISARLEKEDVLKLEALKQLNHQTTSEIVKEAIDVLYRQKRVHPLHSQNSIRALLESDFIGCAKGPKDLSENYKSYLDEPLNEKHPAH